MVKESDRFGRIVPFLIPALRPLLFIGSGLALLLLPWFSGKTLEDISGYWPLLCIVLNNITIITVLLVASSEGAVIKDIFTPGIEGGIFSRKLIVVIPVMLILGIGGLTGISVLIYGYMPVTTIHPLPVWASAVVLLLLPVTIIFAEIPVYLGYSSPRLLKITGSRFFSIAYPLFFYALQHSFMPLIFDIQHIVSRFLMFIPLLIFIGIWYYRDKSLIPLMVGHGILDLITAIQIMIVSLDPSIYELMNSTQLK